MNKTFLAFVKKEVNHILRDPRTLLVAIMIPVVQMILFGFALSMEVNSIDVAAVVPKNGPEVTRTLERLASNPYVDYHGLLANPDEIDGALASNKVMAVVMFSHDYASDGGRVSVLVDGSNPVTAQTAGGYLNSILTEGSEGATPSVTILYNPLLKSSYNFVPGIMGVIFILICSMLTSVSIVREKETGTMEILLVSPIRPWVIFLSKLVPYFLLALIDLTLILLIARFALGVPMSGAMLTLLLISVVYIVMSLCLGLLVSTLVDSQMTALLICGMALIMPSVMLSGLMFPVENMPQVLQWVSNIVPTKWYIASMRKIMIQGLGTRFVLTELAILSAMALLIITVAIKRFNNRLR